MKHLKTILCLVCAALLLAGCDRGRIASQIESMQALAASLEQSVNEMNLNVAALGELAGKIASGSELSQLIPVTDEEKTVGYILRFADNSLVTVYNQPAYVTIDSFEDSFYWKVDGKWLKDSDGNKCPVSSETVSPEFAIAGEILKVSFDGGQSYEEVGKIYDNLVESIYEDNSAVYLKLHSSSLVAIPKVQPLSIDFTSLPEMVAEGCAATIPFTLQGNGQIDVLCAASEGWTASVVRSATEPVKGEITVTAPDDETEGWLKVFVTDGRSTVMKAIDLASMILSPAQTAYVIESDGGIVDIEVTASVDYEAESDASWLRRVETKGRRTEVISFEADANETVNSRTARVSFSCGEYSTEVSVVQKAASEVPAILPGQFDPETDNINANHEFRAVWLATVSGLDWPVAGATAASQRSALRSMMKGIKDCNCNAVIFQVCCNADAVWPSEIYPWSSVLTGTEGVDPGYDPLDFAIDVAHEYGLELHAWINPMRIGSTAKVRAASHPMFSNPEWVCTYDGVNYWNPGYPEVRENIANVAKELMTNYEELDGVHMDDYFYPSAVRRGQDGGAWNDSDAYSRYAAGRTLDAWREYNIDNLVSRIFNKVKDVSDFGVYGVSPAGRLNNTQALYADPTHWAKKHTIDYLAPQIYWYIGHPVADFDSLAHFWPQVMPKVPIMPGIAAYRLGQTGFETKEQFKKQVEICRSIDEIQGQIWFRAAHVTEASFKSYMNTEIYPYPSLVPNYDGYESGELLEAPVLSSIGTNLIWTESPGAEGYALYRLDQDETDPHKWVANMLYRGEKLNYKGNNGCNYIVLAFRKHEKSEFSNVVYLNYKK